MINPKQIDTKQTAMDPSYLALGLGLGLPAVKVEAARLLVDLDCACAASGSAAGRTGWIDGQWRDQDQVGDGVFVRGASPDATPDAAPFQRKRARPEQGYVDSSQRRIVSLDEELTPPKRGVAGSGGRGIGMHLPKPVKPVVQMLTWPPAPVAAPPVRLLLEAAAAARDEAGWKSEPAGSSSDSTGRSSASTGSQGAVCPLCERECGEQHRIGHFWKKLGYDGPAYCNRCSSSFRAHMLMEVVSEKKCSRSVPCLVCTEVLLHFSCSIESAIRNAGQKQHCGRKKKHAPPGAPAIKQGANAPPERGVMAASAGGDSCVQFCGVCQRQSDTVLGTFWKKFGYAGPPYCTLCSHAFRNHIIRQRKTRVECSREAPCQLCQCILSHCARGRQSVYASMDDTKQSLAMTAKKRARQLSPGLPRNTCKSSS